MRSRHQNDAREAKCAVVSGGGCGPRLERTHRVLKGGGGLWPGGRILDLRAGRPRSGVVRGCWSDSLPAMRAVGCATAEREGASSDARGGRAPQFPMVSDDFQSIPINSNHFFKINENKGAMDDSRMAGPVDGRSEFECSGADSARSGISAGRRPVPGPAEPAKSHPAEGGAHAEA